MMISPESYIDGHKNKSLKELIKERNKLIKSIQRFENEEINSREYVIDPSPEVVYQCENDYLIEITKVINERFNEQL